MLREIERRNGKAIVKSTSVRKGAEVINFYGLRSTDATDKPFDSTHLTLWQARKALEA